MNIALKEANVTLREEREKQCTVTTYVLPSFKWRINLRNGGLQTFGKKGRDAGQPLNCFPRKKMQVSSAPQRNIWQVAIEFHFPWQTANPSPVGK